jgi:hypothetical protein
MATIKIDNKDYELEDLSQEARNQLQAIQYVDQEIVRLNLQIAAMQTARNAYGQALNAHLGTEGSEEEPMLDLPDDISFD